MRNTTFILFASLLAGLTFAQEDSSAPNVLSDLGDYEAEAAEVVETVEEVVEVEEVAVVEIPAVEEVPAIVEVPAVEEIPAAELITVSDPIPMDAVPEVIEECRDLYANGEFNEAKAGFEDIIQVAPENKIAQMYLRKILEREFKSAEVGGMDAVDAAWDLSMPLRSYEISPNAVERFEIEEATSATCLIAKFPEVSFPEGSSAIYQPRLEKLFVRNTRPNLLILEEVLDAMDVAKLSADVDQVEIEAKFVEISEGTLEELGFEWGTLAGETYDIIGDVTADGGQYLFDDALRGGPNNATPGLPFDIPSLLPGAAAAAPALGSTRGSGSWSSFRFEDTFNTSAAAFQVNKKGKDPLDLMITALDQSSGADVLSAPRVVTKSGEEAVIRVGEKHLYPEVYEPSASGGNIVHVSYQDWEERLLGVELSVTPQVDGSQIEMELNPKILELQGWQAYDVAEADSSYTWYQDRIGIVFTHPAIQAKLPIFRKREIETEVTIADGATITLGGLINEKIESFEDKVPVLGSLPFIGRLFRNEGERAVKRNLVMFVKASKVEPTGRINSARSFE